MEQIRKFKAFISYRHLPLDSLVAEQVQNLIERYRIPLSLRKEKGKELGLVFRDRTELPLSSNLTEDIYEALDNSEFLIVVCTPDTPKSIWVDREIEYFINAHGRERVLTVLAAGTPAESIPKRITTVCTPDGKTVLEQIEPLCAFLVAEDEKTVLKNLKAEFLRLVAAMISVPYDNLYQRRRRYRARLLAAGIGAISIVIMTILALLIQWNLDVTAKNEEITQVNLQLQDQMRQTLQKESEALTLLSESHYEKGNRKAAAQHALSALPTIESDRPYYAAAERVLVDALGVYEEPHYDSLFTYSDPDNIVNAVLSPSGRYVAVCSHNHIALLDIQEGTEVWKISIGFGASEYSLFIDEENEMMIVSLKRAGLLAYSLSTGEHLDSVPDKSMVNSEYTCEKINSDYSNDLFTYHITPALPYAAFDLTLKDEMSLYNGDVSRDGRYYALAGGKHKYVYIIDCENGTYRQTEISGLCQDIYPTQNGGFLILSSADDENDLRTYRITVIDPDAQVMEQQVLQTSSEDYFFSIYTYDCWVLCVGAKSVQILYLPDGTVLEDVPLATENTMRTVSFLDPENRLVVVGEDGTVYGFFPSENWRNASVTTSAEYRDASGNALDVYWNCVQLYQDENGICWSFIKDENPNGLFLVPVNSDTCRYIGSCGNEAGVVLTEQVLPEQYRDICAMYRQEELNWYTGDSEDQWDLDESRVQRASCPYPELDSNTSAAHVYGLLPSGRNGLIAVPHVPESNYSIQSYAIYSTKTDEWRWFEEESLAKHMDGIFMAEEALTACIVSDDNTIHLYDFPTNTITKALEVPLLQVTSVRFVMEDRYLLLADSENERTLILDTQTWEFVADLEISVSDNSNIHFDAATGRLYIGSMPQYSWIIYGWVIHTGSWEIVAQIENMLFYDPLTDTIVCNRLEIDPRVDGVEGYHECAGCPSCATERSYGWIAYPAYTTQELILLAEDFLYSQSF